MNIFVIFAGYGKSVRKRSKERPKRLFDLSNYISSKYEKDIQFPIDYRFSVLD